MANFWLKLKIWTKLILAFLAVIYIVLFVVYNNDHRATLWLFPGSGKEVSRSVLELVLGAFALGVLVALLARTTMRTIAQIKELKARNENEKRERDLEQLKSRAGMLRPKGDADETVVKAG